MNIRRSLTAFLWLVALMATAQLQHFSLDSSNPDIKWQLAPERNMHDAITGVVPGTVFTAYVEAGREKCPEYGSNIYQVDETKYSRPFWYRTEVVLPQKPLHGQHVWLCLDNTNRYADVFFNGKKVSGTADSEKDISGHMLRSRFDVTSLYQHQKNVVEVKIYDPDQKKTRKAEGPYGVACSPSYLAGAGWDWMPYIPGRLAGITGHARLEVTGDVQLVDPWVRSFLPRNECAELTVLSDVANYSDQAKDVTIEGTIMPGNISFTKRLRVEAGDTAQLRVNHQDVEALVIRHPQLWWPNGYGQPNLYECKLRCKVGNVLSDQRSLRFGIKRYDYRIETNDVGYPVFQLYINGQRLFVKGGNWGMSEYLLRCHGKEYETKIRLHRDMNYNMIRLWTGCVTDDEFYDYCDEQGIMVWNDFWLYVAWNDVVEHDAFKRNARDKVRRLRNHPSIAVWCGANETHPVADIDQALRMIVMEEDGNDRIYKSCSNQDALSGSGWWKDLPPRHHFETSASNLAFNKPSYPYGNTFGYGFRSEIGMATFPQYESVSLFIPKKDQWPLPTDDQLKNEDDNVWNHHFFGKEALNADPVGYRESVDNRYGASKSLEEFCEKAQLINYEDMRGMYEAWQDKMWNDASGLLIWMSHPAYPSFVWQTYDYYYDPTGCYWGARKACEHHHIQWNCLTGSVKVVNTSGEALNNVKAQALVFNIDGQQLDRREMILTVPASDKKEAFVLNNLPKGMLFVRLLLEDSAGRQLSENFYWTNTERDLDYSSLAKMPEVRLTVTQDGKGKIRLKNPSKNVAFANRLRLVDSKTGSRVLPVIWSDNYITLMPGEERIVTFEAEKMPESVKVLVKPFGHKERVLSKVENRATLKIGKLLCENLTNPLGIDNVQPHFSWQLKASVNGASPVAYEIQVSSDSLSLLKGKADLWSTGRVESAEQVMVPYSGKQLQSRQLCYWRVRVWDEHQQPSDWSEVSRFSVGLLNGMAGKYIGMDPQYGSMQAPLLRKQVKLSSHHTTFVYVNSLGYHELYVNGRRMGQNVLQPAMSQLSQHSLIVTYDVSQYVKEGLNDIVIWAGQGWYRNNTFKAQHEGALVKAQIEQLTDNQWEISGQTDSSWLASPSGYEYTGNWYPLQFGGERVDARLVPVNMMSSTLDKRQWVSAREFTVTGMTATPQMFAGNRIIDRVHPVSVEQSQPGEWLFDMGRVLTGWVEMHLDDTKDGQQVTIDYTDYIPLGGKFESQGEGDVFITGGGAQEVFSNKFHHHAFRYVRVRSDVRPELCALQISGTDDEHATFSSSDTDINAIHDMISYTMRCLTFSGYMVDCPHLERMGYGGDGNSSTMTLQTMYNVSPTFLNWLTAWGDVMENDGSLPYVAPAGGGGGGPYWSGFIVQAPWRTYLNYGDKRPLERLFDKMNLWLNYAEKYMVDGILQPWPDTPNRMWFLGDWLAPNGVDVGGESPLLVNNCFLSECLGTMSQIACVLGKDATTYEVRRDALNKRIHETFYHDDTHTYGTGSPLDMSYPMLVGAVPSALYETVKSTLLNRSKTVYNSHLAVGLLGVPIFTEWTIRNQTSDFMLELLKQPDYPGYLNMIANGATTTWEYWNGERSRVHNCYNGIGLWFYQALAGIQPDVNQPGYRHVLIAPQRPQGIEWVKATKPTPYGELKVDWNSDSLVVTIPVGVTADVCWAGKTHKVTSGQWMFR